jgi:hypothetical protein
MTGWQGEGTLKELHVPLRGDRYAGLARRWFSIISVAWRGRYLLII